MTPYIPAIRQCFNCGQLNHSTKFCKNNPKCLTCSQAWHQDGSSCSGITNCINCGGNHRSLSKECPEIIIKKRTTELMATQNMDFNTAKRLVVQGTPIVGRQPVTPVNQRRDFQLRGTDFPPIFKPGPAENNRSQQMHPMTNTQSLDEEETISVTRSKTPISFTKTLEENALNEANNVSDILSNLPEILSIMDKRFKWLGGGSVLRVIGELMKLLESNQIVNPPVEELIHLNNG